VNGRRINSCLTPAVMHEGAEITTIEGLSQDGQLHPVRAHFWSMMASSAAIARRGKSCQPLPRLTNPAAIQMITSANV
jgi:xanthine dehydrogenase YagT iron-sulfur-binding subunit